MESSAIIATVDGETFVVATRLTIRQAHNELRRRNAECPGAQHHIVFDAGYTAGQAYEQAQEVAA